MQTFLPYADFAESAAVLDYRRLGKQRAENIQILRAMTVPGYGWGNHPAVKMWENHKQSFLEYHAAIVHEWHEVRNYNDRGTLQTFTTDLDTYWDTNPDSLERYNFDTPDWLGDPDFHRAHQSNLLRKDPIFYGPKFPGVPDDLDYIWPV